MSKLPVGNIEAIFFDMNGTLRLREAHEPTQRAAVSRLHELLGREDVPDEYWEELARRQKAYSGWAQERLIQLSEVEIWSRWILPELPRERLEPVAAELTMVWSERRGRHVPKTGAPETIRELRQRGYQLGIISNSMSTLDIPRSLAAYGWTDYFEAVILSADLKRRKPAPELFLEAAHRLDMTPARCAYVGNRVSRDIVGCKRAGFTLGILLEGEAGPRLDDKEQTVAPDAVIHTLGELLEIFP